jgi:D-serine dehydratase
VALLAVRVVARKPIYHVNATNLQDSWRNFISKSVIAVGSIGAVPNLIGIVPAIIHTVTLP